MTEIRVGDTVRHKQGWSGTVIGWASQPLLRFSSDRKVTIRVDRFGGGSFDRTAWSADLERITLPGASLAAHEEALAATLVPLPTPAPEYDAIADAASRDPRPGRPTAHGLNVVDGGRA